VPALSPDRVLPLLHGRFGRPYLYAETCATTQQALAADLPEGAVAVCEEQRAGRGRLGRSWEVPPRTGILCSVLLRPPPASAKPELSLVAGLAVAETVESLTDRRTEIKWPNDVLLGGRKVAGILAEARGESVILGIGLNVNQRIDQLPADRIPPASSLLVVDGVERDRADALVELLVHLERRYDEWAATGGLATLLPALEARDALRGRLVQIDGVTGVGGGVDEHGRLRIESEDGLRFVSSGEVTVITLLPDTM
jgi:BirA family biotin operon repressor/biotin-[acetyl-CoA-carboxylase] ligase